MKDQIVPKHIAIIMDGNRRWARAHHKHPLAGHQYVADVLLEALVKRAKERGILYVTLWAWSTENWNRAPQEVSGVMKLFKHVLKRSTERLHKNGVKILTIGNIEAFPKDIRQEIKESVEKTKSNKNITVILALNYGGRDEIVRAMNKATSEKIQVTRENKQKNTSHLSLITKNDFSHFLDTKGIPDPELIIRTGGEKRLSGFLLWQSEYSELYFTDTLMPDFTPKELDKALEDFAIRQRRFGK